MLKVSNDMQKRNTKLVNQSDCYSFNSFNKPNTFDSTNSNRLIHKKRRKRKTKKQTHKHIFLLGSSKLVIDKTQKKTKKLFKRHSPKNS